MLPSYCRSACFSFCYVSSALCRRLLILIILFSLWFCENEGLKIFFKKHVSIILFFHTKQFICHFSIIRAEKYISSSFSVKVLSREEFLKTFQTIFAVSWWEVVGYTSTPACTDTRVPSILSVPCLNSSSLFVWAVNWGSISANSWSRPGPKYCL